MRGLEAIPALLRGHGVTTVFAMLAETNGPWLGHGVEHGLIRLVRVRHEETAVMAAVGFARSTGRVGVASVTRGPGFANSINALASAADMNIPLLLITGHSPRAGAQSQQLEQCRLAGALGIEYHHVASITRLADVLRTAIRDARRHGRPEIVAVDQGVLEEEGHVGPARQIDVPAVVPSHSAIQAVAAMSANARRPLVVAGHGAVEADAGPALRGLAERIGAGAGTTLLAIGMFDGHGNDVGLVGGWAPRAARAYLRSVDLVLAFGASLNVFTLDRGTLFADAALVQVVPHAGAASIVHRPDVLVLGDAGVTAGRLLDAVGQADAPVRPFVGAGIADFRASLVDTEAGRARDGMLDAIAVAAAVDELLPPDRLVVTDSGRAVIPLPDLLAAPDARSWVHGRGYGSIGQGLGLAIGAAVAHPDRTVALFVGDGAFLASCHDLDAVRLAGLRNLVIVVLNDERYGMETHVMQEHHLPLDTISQSTPDLVALAKAYGGDGVRIANPVELRRLRIPLGRGLFVVDARIDPESDPALAVGDGLETK
jgi:thiamine pyrophosphate-dependent acetolactate synthase large subunit-like protein